MKTLFKELKENIQNQFTEFQENMNKNLEKTQKQLNELREYKHQNKTKKILKKR
jgi:xylose isomerase